MAESVDKVTARSCAKINLTLEVLRKRDDGYHEIRSLMQAIDFCDEIEFERTDVGAISIECNRDDIPTNDDNLIAKAFYFLKDRYGIPGGLKVKLRKRIPPGSGLGGGSSNCATTIKAMDEMFGLGMSRDDKMRLGAELGSDVPFFLGSGSSVVTGRGEIVKDLKLPLDYGVILVLPDVSISTRNVYNSHRIGLTKKIRAGRFSIQHNTTGTSDLFGLVSNDLEEAVFRISPEIRAIKSVLVSSGLDCVSVSGSGSALFALERIQGFERSHDVVCKRLSGCLIAKARPVRLA